MEVVGKLDFLANFVVVRQLESVHDTAHRADHEVFLHRTDTQTRDANAIVTRWRDHLHQVVLRRENPRAGIARIGRARHRRRVKVHTPHIRPSRTHSHNKDATHHEHLSASHTNDAVEAKHKRAS